MTATAPLQFGVPEPGVAYRDRPAAFGVVPRGGHIAVVCITTSERPPFFDLPGGALEAGESAEQAMAREFGEEAGLVVRAGPRLLRADQYLRKADGEPVNNRSSVFLASLDGENPALKIEDDHELVWMEPVEALRRLRHDSHAWAVACWLRAGPT